MKVCVVITAAVVMLLRDFGSYGIFMTVSTTLDFPVILDGLFFSWSVSYLTSYLYRSFVSRVFS
jgi:hypothetical protein